jgi:hypothetical protein
MLMELLTGQFPMVVGSEVEGYSSEPKQAASGKSRVNQFLYDTLGTANKADPSRFTAINGALNQTRNSLDRLGIDPTKLSQTKGRNASEKQVIQELLSHRYGALRV